MSDLVVHALRLLDEAAQVRQVTGQASMTSDDDAQQFLAALGRLGAAQRAHRVGKELGLDTGFDVGIDPVRAFRVARNDEFDVLVRKEFAVGIQNIQAVPLEIRNAESSDEYRFGEKLLAPVQRGHPNGVQQIATPDQKPIILVDDIRQIS